ncbi:sucrose-6-phosphate hydrolase [Oceanobacillus sp. CFH 90083]|uniref:glycoside hydrolase family 32 protein n=1 Tax=Oceanobacillus sp. CFH 90083 TaxID=2592336 RepID=UPI00128BBFB2|nr:sucrose-6-phosphate hydrolase [Oceanobacillus sp. CFH 90083]
MSWTRETRYRHYREMTEAEEQELLEKVSKSIWRQKFHIQPPYGLLNDPNGFTFYQGKYHLFYQWFPFGPVHGMKHWYHVESEDLIHWEEKGVGIAPEYDHESHGIFSGSGIVKADLLYLFYTANKRDQDWNRVSSQSFAVMDKQGRFTKQEEPVIPKQPEGYTANFRDPKVWKNGNTFYMIIGAERENHTGCALLYKSADLLNWSFQGELKTDFEQFGYMWECPDIFQIEGNDVLILSPQGLEPEGDSYHNVHNSGCFIGHFDKEKYYFQSNAFQELDAGFDFYAPQTTQAPDGRQILVGWMGLPDTSYPADKDMWSNCLTIPRELQIKNNKIYQVPVKEMIKKRGALTTWQGNLDGEERALDNFLGAVYELNGDMTVEDGIAGLKLRTGKEEETLFYLDTKRQKIVLDRTNSGVPTAVDYGTVRQTSCTDNKISLRIFMDTSSVEIFVNEGEFVFTSRIFPQEESKGIKLFAEDTAASFALNKWDYTS